MKNKLTKLEFKWICYDMGNSAFILLVATILPIYFNYLSSSQGVAEHNYLSYWSYAASLSTLIVALAGPILGTLADYKDHKKKIFLTCAMLGALALACFWIPSSWFAFLVLFIAAKVAYSLSLIVYDSMLTDITTEERMDAVSSKGYAWGYIASVVPFIISLVFVLMYDKMGMTLKTAMMIAFILNAVWWIAFTLPLVKSYKQKFYIEPEAHPVLDTFARLKDTLMKAKEQKKVFLFLFAFFFYIDGVYTITADEYLNAYKYEDSVSRCSHPIDIHAPKGESQRCSFLKKAAYVPYRSLIANGFPNIIVAGRTLSAEKEAFASLRVQASCMGIGQAAGYAAAMASENNANVKEIDTISLVEKLKIAGAILD